jgi:hypothetical protein
MTINQKITEIREYLSKIPGIENFEVKLQPISDNAIDFEMIGRHKEFNVPERLFKNDSHFFRKKKIITLEESFNIEL